jgi:hypothetical protein
VSDETWYCEESRYCDPCGHSHIIGEHDQGVELPWYCEMCERSHVIDGHDEGVSWPIRFATDVAPSRRCWCGRSVLDGGRCEKIHDPFDLYMCSCGLHLFAAKHKVSPGAWAWHLNHIAAFQAEMQARVDKAIADAAPVASQDVPGWAASAVAVLAERGLL